MSRAAGPGARTAWPLGDDDDDGNDDGGGGGGDYDDDVKCPSSLVC